MLDYIRNISFGEFQWTEIIYTIGGSFIGIFIPMWIEKSRARRQEKDARKKLLSSLNRELDSVKRLIEDYGKPEHQYDIFSFSTFVWESIISAGMLPDMLADKDIQCELLMEIYSDLALLQELHDGFCQCAHEEDLRMIYDSIMQKRNEIHEKIDRYQNAGNGR